MVQTRKYSKILLCLETRRVGYTISLHHCIGGIAKLYQYCATAKTLHEILIFEMLSLQN